MPSSAFLLGVAANLKYWQKCASTLEDQALKTLEINRQNLYRAVKTGLLFPETQIEATHLAMTIFDFVELGRYWQEWKPVLTSALAIKGLETHIRCRLLNQLGFLHMHTRQYDEAFVCHNEALALAKGSQNRHELANAYLGLGQISYSQRAYETAAEYGQRALEEFVQPDADLKKLANVYNMLGIIAQAQGQYSTAESYFNMALHLYSQVNATLKAHGLNNLALAYQAQKKYEEAHRCFLEALTLLETQGQRWLHNNTLNSLGTLYFSMARYHEAEITFLAMDVRFLHNTGNHVLLAQRLNNLGEVYFKQKRESEAEKFFRQALPLWKKNEDMLNFANTLGSLAEILAYQGKVAESLVSYEEAINILQPLQGNEWARSRQMRLKAQRRQLQE